MTEKSIANSNKPDFNTLMPNYSDEQIINVLKKRKLYRPEAAELAIQIAIKRGLIHSEQDLFSEKFNETPSKFTLFPNINNKAIQNKLRKSAARILLIVGVIPVVWGGIKIYKNSFFEGVLLILLGGIWIYAAAKLMQSLQFKMVNLLILIL